MLIFDISTNPPTFIKKVRPGRDWVGPEGHTHPSQALHKWSLKEWELRGDWRPFELVKEPPPPGHRITKVSTRFDRRYWPHRMIEEVVASEPIPEPNQRYDWSDFISEALTPAERVALFRAAQADDGAADFYMRLQAHNHVTLGDDLTDPERQKTEGLLDLAIAAGWVASERKAEILAWRPGEAAAAPSSPPSVMEP